jgi:hypothetical protein
LSDIINQIEPLQKENESLRALLNSQQTTLNELSGLVMKLLSNGLPSYSSYSNNENTLTDNGMSSMYEHNNEQYTEHILTDCDANIIDGGCTLTVTNLEDVVEGEEKEEEEVEDVTDEKQEDGQHVDS